MSDSLEQKPGYLPIETYRGDNFHKVIEFTDELNAALDMSDVIDIGMQIRKKPGEPILDELTSGNGLTLVDNKIIIDHIFTLEKGKYKYDLQITYTGSKPITYLSGPFTMIDDITR